MHRALIPLMLLMFPALGWAGQETGPEAILRGLDAFAANTPNHLALLLAIAAATLISEDLACIGAGLLAAKGVISPAAAVLSSGAGIYAGDVLLYLCGYVVGVRALHHAPLKWFVSEGRVARAKELFERRGLALIFLCRFIPGTRTATFIGAGLVRVHPTRLLAVFALAVMLWTPLPVLGAMLVGRQAIYYADIYRANALWVFVALFGTLYLAMRLIVPLFTWRGRRLLLGRWRRFSRWEFWPYYVTNSVTLLWVLCLGLCKYRNPTLFTAVNPAIEPDGGFIGESKSAIYGGLPQEFVGRWRLVPASWSGTERRRELEAFMKTNDLAYPVVLKPDRGERGRNVAVCRDASEAEAWLAEIDEDFIIMEFLPGEEFGVFYYRMPGAPRGVIFSIARKKLLHVCGDGHRTLEELILADERAVCLAELHLNVLERELTDIPKPGEIRQLVRVGTHSRGSLFLDGGDLLSDELHEAIEAIVRPYTGFYLGRFDLKAPSESDFKKGRALKVVELNGVTSEAAHIYDPSNSVFVAWKTLIKQWEIAFRIAAANVRSGHCPMKPLAFLRHLVRSSRANRQGASRPEAARSRPRQRG